MARYIDADALCEALMTRWNTADKNAEKLISEVMADIVTPIIAGIPAADVVEVVHGEWIDKGEDYMIRWTCSNCGRRDTHIYNFCPDCGADMRGGTE